MIEPGIHCPNCDGLLSVITDTRLIEDGKRRRRVCHHCKQPFHTIEATESDIAARHAVEGGTGWRDQSNRRFRP